MGGLARRASYLQQIKDKFLNVLILDAGNALGKAKYPEIKNRAVARGQNMIGYDFMNVAANELQMGPDLLGKYIDDLDVPLLSSNLHHQGEKPLWQPWGIVKLKDYKIGILGVVSPKELDPFILQKGKFSVVPIQKALHQYLPDLKQQTDYAVVVANTSFDEAREIARQNQDVDLVLVGGKFHNGLSKEVVGNTSVCKNGNGGSQLNISYVYMNSTGKFETEQEIVKLNDGIKTDKSFFEPIRLYSREPRDHKTYLRKHNTALKQDLNKYKSMSPEEFMKIIKKNNGRFSLDKDN